MPRSILGFFFSLCLLVPGCDDAPRLQGRVCEPGATRWCACPAALTGVQVCADPGDRWGPCGQCSAVQRDGGQPVPLPGTDGAAPGTDGGAPVDANKPPQQALPVMFVAGHYLTYKGQLGGLGPFIVYAWAADPALSMYANQLQDLAQIKAPGVEEWVMFSSLKTAQAKLADPSHVSYLKSIGVTGLGYNTEGDKTPQSEMQDLTQAVTQFAQLATSRGFDAVWGPIRSTAETTSNASYTQMIAAGLDGVGLQEQKWIEQACVGPRAQAVKALSARLKQLKPGFSVQVQLMPSRCLNGDAYAAKSCGTQGPQYFHCQGFSDQIAASIDSLAIWASGPADNAGLVPLIEALRHK